MNSREEGKRIIKVGTEDFYNNEATLLTVKVVTLKHIPKHGICPVVIYCPGQIWPTQQNKWKAIVMNAQNGRLLMFGSNTCMYLHLCFIMM